MLYLIDPAPFLIARIILFFVATMYIYKSLQAIDYSKIFRKNTAESIRFLFMVISIVLGFLFVDAIVSLFEYLNQLL